MSTLHVKVREIEKIEDHPNADKLKVATVRGWKICIGYNPDTGKADFNEGDLCVHFPPDSVLPPELANSPDDDIPGRLNVKKYLAPLRKDSDGERSPGGRVRATRLRGVESYGILMKIAPELGDSPLWKPGDDVAEHFGVTKWEPPETNISGDSMREHSRFYKYTDIEHYGNYPEALKDGETVIISEKLHGSNCRLGMVLDESENEGAATWISMAGSHNRRRKEYDSHGRKSLYWKPMTDNVKNLLKYLVDKVNWSERKNSVQIFGEVYGSGIQDMAYGFVNGQVGFRAFDISINNQYLDYDIKHKLFKMFDVEMVPVLYKGPFDKKILEELTSGPTTVCSSDVAGKFKGREGVVIVPIKERYEAGELNGRCILKSISADYLARRGGTDSH